MDNKFVIDLNDGRLSVTYLESLIYAIESSKPHGKAADITITYWDGSNVNNYEIKITDVDTMFELIMDHLIKCEEYELCDTLLTVKNDIK